MDFDAAREGGEGSDSPDTTPLPPPPRPEEAPTLYLSTVPTPDGVSLSVRWTAPDLRSAKDWVGIYVPGAPDSPSIVWKYVPEGAHSGTMAFQLPQGSPYEARYFLDDGYTLAAKSNEGGIVAQPPPPPEPVDRLRAALAVINLAAGPAPISDPRQLISWGRSVLAMRESNPALAEAIAFIEVTYPPKPDGSGGLFGALAKFGNTVVNGVRWIGNTVARAADTIAGAVGSVISFIGGGFPTPADYEPENLCVTAWTDPPKFALLSAVAAIVFPPALLYMGVYVPPNVTGLTLGIAEALAKGGTDRVISKILDPLYNAVKDLAGALIDFALNGKPALVRWAIRKIAERLKDEPLLQGILLGLSEAADSIIEAIRDVTEALKSESFYVDLGDAIKRAAQKFFEGNQSIRDTLTWIGGAISGGGIAIATLVEKGVDGLQEAFAKLAEKILGIPADFDRLSERVRIEIAKAKAQITSGGKSALDLFHVFVSNLRSGVAAVADALRKLPFKIGDILGSFMDLLGELVARAEAFILGLLGLAQQPEPESPPPAPAPAPPTQPDRDEPAAPSGGGLLWMIGAAVAGGLLAGPPGAIGGAAAGALLGKGK
jgi:hypothetical protein